MFGFYRVAAAVPKVRVADVCFNVENIIDLWRIATKNQSVAVLFPELSVSSYSCADLFFQETLHKAIDVGIAKLLEASVHLDTIAIVGAPLWHKNRLYNCAIVVQNGHILGVVPKIFIPEHKEYYEKRWFSSGKDIKNEMIEVVGQSVPFGIDLLFKKDSKLIFGIEICEDLWSVIPPSSYQAIGGATLLFNLSASDEVVGKSDYRKNLVVSASARYMAAYVYTSCGVGESTTDVVFGGDAMIAENGSLLEQGRRFLDESQIVFADVDLARLKMMRISESSFSDTKYKEFRVVTLFDIPQIAQLNRFIDPHPFVPSDKRVRAKRCKEIFSIQTAALAKRLKHIDTNVCVIGVSGGLDSTLALLATYKTYETIQKDPKDIVCVTMPGFGTTKRTYENAKKLCKELDVTFKTVDITNACLDHFKAIEHDPNEHTVVYENVQARERTQILMDLANKLNGIVIGTGDLSELALGWSTYNGDHMSMYAINSGIPKTLIRHLVEWVANTNPKVCDILQNILKTPVSPELLPTKDDVISQKTEDIIGPYELHDFFLYHMIKSGATPKKILFLAKMAFKQKYDDDTLKKWLKLFLERFFLQQFKRSCMPDGPKVGTISLSPRGDWRMPSDAVVSEWIKGLDDLSL